LPAPARPPAAGDLIDVAAELADPAGKRLTAHHEPPHDEEQ
jgi:hypothetical protein